MPPEQSNPRVSYTHRGGGGYSRGRGRGSRRTDGNGGQDSEQGAGRNQYYPGRSQNPDAANNNDGKRWERPMTSTDKNQTQYVNGAEADVNMPMVQADEIPAQAMQTQRTAPPKSRQTADCPWIDWDVYLPQEGKEYEAEVPSVTV